MRSGYTSCLPMKRIDWYPLFLQLVQPLSDAFPYTPESRWRYFHKNWQWCIFGPCHNRYWRSGRVRPEIRGRCPTSSLRVYPLKPHITLIDSFTSNCHGLPGRRSDWSIRWSFERGWSATFLEEDLGVALRPSALYIGCCTNTVAIQCIAGNKFEAARGWG